CERRPRSAEPATYCAGWTKMSGHVPGVRKPGQVLVSPNTRFDAEEKKATVVPDVSIAGSVLARLPCPPSSFTLRRVVGPAARLRTNTSGHSPGRSGSSKNGGHELVSSGTRFVASESNVTRFPSPLIDGGATVPPRMPGPLLWPFAWLPSSATDTRSVTPL